MSKFEFDERNQRDFHENTTLIMDALEKIRKDPTIKPYVKTLSDLTGIHRNTLSNRVWPLQKLDEIKAHRLSISNKQKSKSTKRTESVLLEKLDNAQKELLYWFTLHKKLSESYKQLKENYDLMVASRDTSSQSAEMYKKKVEELQKKIELLMTLH